MRTKKRKKRYALPDTEIVEVVLRKEMTYAKYKELIRPSRVKGWWVQAYAIGKFSPPMDEA